MATSSKVVFKLETLRTKALESIDERIKNQELVVAGFDDADALAEQVKAWRARQEAKLSELFASLNDIDDYQLSRFRLDEIPEVNRWDRSRAETDLRQLKAKRSKILAKTEALVPDSDGNIALTKTQLMEFFGL